MRLPYLGREDCLRQYEGVCHKVSQFTARNQYSWYVQAYELVRLASLEYALGNPLSETRTWLRKSVETFRELFRLRGQSFYTRVRYKDGQPLPEEKIFEDGYSSVESFTAALIGVIAHDLATARSLVELAGHSPNAQLVSPKSEVCNSNQQTLSHALNALFAADLELADHETRKLTVRRGSPWEKQLGTTISAIASNGDLRTELESMLSCHKKRAMRPDNHPNATYYLCLPALGLAQLGVHLGRLQRTDLDFDNIYFPADLLPDA